MKKLIYNQIVISILTLAAFFLAWKIIGKVDVAMSIVLTAFAVATTIVGIFLLFSPDVTLNDVVFAVPVTLIAVAVSAISIVHLIVLVASVNTFFAVLWMIIAFGGGAAICVATVIAITMEDNRIKFNRAIVAVLIQFAVICVITTGTRRGLSWSAMIPVFATLVLVGAFFAPSLVRARRRRRLEQNKSVVVPHNHLEALGVEKLKKHIPPPP